MPEYTNLSEAQFLNECAKRNVQPFRSTSGSVKRPMFVNGFTFNTPAGGTTTFQIKLNASAREMLGLVVMDAFTSDIATLKVNNDILLQDVSLGSYNPQLNIYKDAQYYKLPRQLSGNDNITLSVSSSIAHLIFPVFYLLPA